jgi:hypothetical protein
MENNNRILTEITAWNDRLKNLQGVFGNHVADYDYVIRAKLECFNKIKAKYKIPVNQDEKIASKILQAEIRRLEKIAFPNRFERFVRKTIENARIIFEKVLLNGRSNQQIEMNNETSSGQKQMNTSSSEKNLNKTAIQYSRKLKAVKDETLLPKLRSAKTKGLKI